MITCRGCGLLQQRLVEDGCTICGLEAPAQVPNIQQICLECGRYEMIIDGTCSRCEVVAPLLAVSMGEWACGPLDEVGGPVFTSVAITPSDGVAPSATDVEKHVLPSPTSWGAVL